MAIFYRKMDRFLVEKLLISLLSVIVCVVAGPPSQIWKDVIAKKTEELSDELERNSGEDDDDDKNYEGIYIGIGVVGGLIVLVVIFVCAYRSAKKRREEREMTRTRNLTFVASRNHITTKHRDSISNENYSGPTSYGATSSIAMPSAPEEVVPNPMRAAIPSPSYQEDREREPPPPYFATAPQSEEVLAVISVDNHWKLKVQQ